MTFNCPQCSKSFKSQKCLDKHKLTCKKVKAADAEEKKQAEELQAKEKAYAEEIIQDSENAGQKVQEAAKKAYQKAYDNVMNNAPNVGMQMHFDSVKKS